ncbi:MAG: metalloregulator ArsR/SmtB family transcription factor [Candidatus Methanoplasma sp.]|jgi:ArsR family transcriptional regulator|nr:metalloregulator ArsR/SmtB family transcription factor [Candidatus Methanoplasma sp.]
MINELDCCDSHHNEILKKAYDNMPDDETVFDLSDIFKILSDSTRLKILWAMEGGEICVRGVSELLGISISAVSHQLKTLRRAHLVKSRRDGKNIYYSLDDDHVKKLLEIALEHMRE